MTDTASIQPHTVTTLTYIVIVISCLILSAFFSSSETALMRIRREQVEQDINGHRGPAAATVRELLKSSSRLLVTILLGNNVANILAASAASAIAVIMFGERMGLLLSTIVMTLVIFTFSEVLPKAIAASNPRRVSYFVSIPLYLFHQALRPIHLIFDFIIDPLVKKLAGMPEDASKEKKEEILYLARQLPVSKDTEREFSIISSAAQAANLTAENIMIPIRDVVAFSTNTPIREIFSKLLNERYTRAPVFDQDIDHVTGLVHFKDVVLAQEAQHADIKPYIKPVLRVPEGKPILHLLADMQRTFIHMAIVKDDMGGTVGIITQEDILEEIVGEIRDEFDSDELGAIKGGLNGEFEVLGRVKVADFNRETSSSIKAEHGHTLAGLVFNLLGHPPQKGESVQQGRYRLTVLETSGMRVVRVRIEQIPQKASQTKKPSSTDTFHAF